MNRIILDINKQVELTAFYTKANDNLYVKTVYVYENGIETKYKTDIKARSIEEVKERLMEKYSNNKIEEKGNL